MLAIDRQQHSFLVFGIVGDNNHVPNPPDGCDKIPMRFEQFHTHLNQAPSPIRQDMIRSVPTD